ncbi:MAG TPA: DoxX family protein [Casimicrobiaceae bacterium]|nr:DoxX family protein [Casimicrobiaceae bacterium]
MSIATLSQRIAQATRTPLAVGADLLELAIRFYVAKVFFLSGLTKIRDWSTTLALFHDEYHVPLLPPDVAAALGAFGELAFPVFLVAGLGTRFAALGLSFVNAVAVISYWQVLSSAAPALAQHAFWATLLLVILFHGPGRISLDAWILRGGAGAPDARTLPRGDQLTATR